MASSPTKPAGAQTADAASTNDRPLIVKTADSAAADVTSGTCTVAPGRTVVTADGSYTAGQTVTLDDKDAKRFTGLGFLLDQDGAAIVRADGPAVNVEDGVQISQAGA